MATAEDQQKKSEMNDQLREYISQWRDERAKEEAELKRRLDEIIKRIDYSQFDKSDHPAAKDFKVTYIHS